MQLRQVLEELFSRKQSDALLEVVFGVLLKAEKVIEDQAVEIQHLRKQLFGRRSERLSPDQLSLFAQMLASVTAPPVEVPSDSDGPATIPNKRKRKKTVRRPLVPTRSHDIPIPEGERDCPHCGGPRGTFDHTRTIVIEYTPPKIDVIEYLREKVVCRSCEGEISEAPPPAERVIDGALPGPQLLAALTVNQDGRRLAAQPHAEIFARSGLDIPIQTLNRWEGYSHQLLAPVIGERGSIARHSDGRQRSRSGQLNPVLEIVGLPGAARAGARARSPDRSSAGAICPRRALPHGSASREGVGWDPGTGLCSPYEDLGQRPVNKQVFPTEAECDRSCSCQELECVCNAFTCPGTIEEATRGLCAEANVDYEKREFKAIWVEVPR